MRHAIRENANNDDLITRATEEVAYHIDDFYNLTRRHSYLGGLSLEQVDAAIETRWKGLH